MKNPQSSLFIIVTACLLAFFGCAPSGGGGGSGSDQTTPANIPFGSGQYSGYYKMISNGPQYISCDDGRSESGDLGFPVYDVAISHQGSSLSVYNWETGVITMMGSVLGDQFDLVSLPGNSTGDAWIRGTLSRSGWSGTFSGTLTSGSYLGCSWLVTFTGTRSSTLSYAKVENHSDKTSRHRLSEDDSHKESISKIEQYFGSPMSSD